MSSYEKSGIAFTDYGKQQKVLSDFIVAKPLLENQISKEEETDLVKKVQTFLAHAIPKYKRDCCKFEQFLSNSKNRDFLRNDFPLPESLRIEQGLNCKEYYRSFQLADHCHPH